MRFKRIIKIFIGKCYAKKMRYDSKYLTGRWFSAENNYIGWNWVIQDAKNCCRAGVNLNCPWPVSSDSRVVGDSNVEFHPDDLNNFQHFGCYIQGKGKIIIGKGTWIAPNVGIITSNHNLKDLNKHDNAKDVIIGKNCWIGMNSVILPGVELGPNTIVGAGSVVTKSFPEGGCVIAGNPAKKIRNIVSGDEVCISD